MDAPRRILACIAIATLAACGGGGGGGSSSSTTPPAPVLVSGFTDPVLYSSAASASLATAAEITTTTRRTITLGGVPRAYTAKVGHLSALASGSGQPEASFFYVAYTLDDASAATRPVTFFYNGGPGSATVWLHLGSYGPRRIATDTPGAAGPTPYPLVDNTESLLDTTDLVFVDAVGSGWSEAIAPFTNRSFWGVDEDAGVFRDFIQRWLLVNGRTASPRFLFGESYGTTRSAVLGNLLEMAGVDVNGIVLQSSALDYNSNCGIVDTPPSCSANLPTYNAAAAWYGLAPLDLANARVVGDTRWDPVARASIANPATTLDPQLATMLAAVSGLAAGRWQLTPNLGPVTFQQSLRPGNLIGIYDARVSAPNGTSLTVGGDPSNAYIARSFATRIIEYLGGELGYTNPSSYTMLSSAIDVWNFRHDGRDLPDTVPDLASAFAHNPRLKVFSTGGFHDLATPFHVTEKDTARLGAAAPLAHYFYPGGHMTYLDDAARRQQKADLVEFMRSVL